MVVNRLLTILLVLSLAAMPFRAYAPAVSGCSSPIPIAAFADSDHRDTKACCVAKDDQSNPSQPDPDLEDDRCDEDDCPLPCCGIATSLAGLPVETKKLLFHGLSKQFGVTAQATQTPPHISRLKRPPRPTTAT